MEQWQLVDCGVMHVSKFQCRVIAWQALSWKFPPVVWRVLKLVEFRPSLFKILMKAATSTTSMVTGDRRRVFVNRSNTIILRQSR